MKSLLILFITLLFLSWFSSWRLISWKVDWPRKVKYKVEFCSPVETKWWNWCMMWHFWCHFWSYEVTANSWFYKFSWGWDQWAEAEGDDVPQLLNALKNIRLVAEWTFTITVRAYDNFQDSDITWVQTVCDDDFSEKWNCTEHTVIYKIDKTHPMIWEYPIFEENVENLYTARDEWNYFVTTKEYDTNGRNSDSIWPEAWPIRWEPEDLLDNPSLTNVKNSSWETEEKTNLQTLYYNDTAANFTLKLKTDDRWTPYVSDIKKIDILDKNRNPIAWGLSTPSLPWSTEGSYKVFGMTKDTWLISGVDDWDWYLYFRVYDNAWNYSEIPFAVAYDNTPVLDEDDFINNFISFIWDDWSIESIFSDSKRYEYKTNFNYYPTKFFAADKTKALRFWELIDDENTDTSDVSWPALIKVKVEEVGSACTNAKVKPENIWNSYLDIWNFNWTEKTISLVQFDDDQPNQMISNWQDLILDFSDTEECLLTHNASYRYYRMVFISEDDDWNQKTNKLCDKLLNCLEVKPILFRTVANELDPTKSTYEVWTELSTDNKMLANWKSKYNNEIEIVDMYENNIRPVYSMEDDEILKDILVTIDYDNNLFKNQISLDWDMWTYYKVPWDYDLDHPASVPVNWIAFQNQMHFSEKESESVTENWETWDGIYLFDIFSYVPTYDMYKWMDDWSKLRIENMRIQTVASKSSWELVHDDNMWLFNLDTMNGTDYIDFEIDNGGMAYSSGVNNYFHIDNTYWDVGFDSRQLFLNSSEWYKFDFWAPLLAWFEDLRNVTEWIQNNFDLNLWRLWSLDWLNAQVFHDMRSNVIWLLFKYYWYVDWNDPENSSWEFDLLWLEINDLGDNLNNIFSIPFTEIPHSLELTIKPFLNPDLSDLLAWALNVESFRFAIVSKLLYKFNSLNWEQIVILPSDWRWIDADDEFWDSMYVYWDDSDFNEFNTNHYNTDELNPLAQSIKITWLQATEWRTWWKAAAMTWGSHGSYIETVGDIKKFEINSDVKKNVTSLMRWRDWYEWDIDNLDTSSFNDYWFDSWKEKILAIEWNVTINSDIQINWIKTLIVNWSLKINANISKSDNNSLLNIIVLNQKVNTIKEKDYHYGINPWFIYVDGGVTNIDSYIYVEGSILSYDNNTNKIFMWDNVSDTDLWIFNQLFVRWWIVSSNTVWWSRLDGWTCPWFQDPCDMNIAQWYDYIYFRRYHLVDASQYWWFTWDMVPYVPVSVAQTIDEYNLVENRVYMWWKRFCIISPSTGKKNCSWDDWINLKNIEDKYMEYPLYIEFDPTIVDNRSILFK